MPIEDGTELPPVPPTTPPPINLGDPALGRHVAPNPGPLVTPDGLTIPPLATGDPLINRRGDLPASRTSVAEIGQDVAELDSRGADHENEIRRLHRDVLIVGLFTAVALILALAVGYLLLSQRSTFNQSQNRELAVEVQQAQINEQHRDALCRTVTERLGILSNTIRTAYPAGVAAYDQNLAALRQSVTELGCGT